MPASFSPTRCHVNTGAIARNFRRLGNPAALMPVIKADAYGHGLLPVARALADAGARRFAVGGAPEGEVLRAAGHDQQILLLLGCHEPEEWRQSAACGLVPLVHDFASLEQARALGQRLQIAIKCDTGMGRLGFSQEDIPAIAEKLRAAPLLEPALVVSHLASADMPEDAPYAASQIRAFEAFADALAQIFPALERSLGNSAAALGLPDASFDILRPGLAIYGGNPFAGTALAERGEGLEWAMALSSPILQVKRLRRGQSVSYGRIFTAPRDMDIAVVACGYSQGLPRGLSGRMDMLVGGRRAPQIGRICMGMAMLDVSHLPTPRKGERAWILGGEPQAGETAPSALELANLLETIPYEIFCLMGALNPREYENS